MGRGLFENFGKFEKQSSKFWNIRKIGREQMNDTQCQVPIPMVSLQNRMNMILSPRTCLRNSWKSIPIPRPSRETRRNSALLLKLRICKALSFLMKAIKLGNGQHPVFNNLEFCELLISRSRPPASTDMLLLKASASKQAQNILRQCYFLVNCWGPFTITFGKPTDQPPSFTSVVGAGKC